MKLSRLAPHDKSTVSRTMAARPRTPAPTPPGRSRWTSSFSPTSKHLLRPRQRAETTADFLRELRLFAAKTHPPPETTGGHVNQSKHGELEGSRKQTDSRANPYAKQEGAWLSVLGHAPSVLPPPRRRRRKLSQSSFELPGFPRGLGRQQRAGRGLGSAADWVRIGRSTRTRFQL